METNLADRSRALDDRKAEFSSRQREVELKQTETEARLNALQRDLEEREAALAQWEGELHARALAPEPQVRVAHPVDGTLTWEEIREVWADFRAEVLGGAVPESNTIRASEKVNKSPRTAPAPEVVAERKASAEEIRKRAARVRAEAEARKARMQAYRKRE